MGSAYERDHPGGLRSSIPDPKGRNVRFLPPILMAILHPSGGASHCRRSESRLGRLARWRIQD